MVPEETVVLLSLTTTHQPATDLGYLLHKHPDQFQTIDLSFGKAHIFYPEATKERTTVCLMLDLDSIDLVRGTKRTSSDGFGLRDYVNDRPYVASSFLSVAMSKAFSSAMNGNCKERPELVEIPFPFEVSISALPVPSGGIVLLKKFFEPLGYEVEAQRQTLDNHFPEWGESKYYSVRLRNTLTTRELLSHLYVLIPALDSDKHYYVSQSEIEKLLQKGEGWLKSHPEREQITRRYLIDLNSLSRQALDRLGEGETLSLPTDILALPTEESVKRETLHEKRLKLVAEKLRESGAQSVLDLGCGEGKLLAHLLKNKAVTKIAGMDVSYQALLKAKERLHYEEMSPKQKERLDLFQGSVIYRDQRLSGFDAAAVVEVIEHLEPNRLRSFERVLFEFAKPGVVVLTTPNKDYNELFETLDADEFRHEDHRFEWTREEFGAWAKGVSEKYHYSFELFPVGEIDEKAGAPSQMVVFSYGD